MSDEPELIVFPMDDGSQIVARPAGKFLADQRLRDRALEQQTAENAQLRAELRYRQVLEKYNRAHGQNKKITMKDICAREGVSYAAFIKWRSRNPKAKTRK